LTTAAERLALEQALLEEHAISDRPRSVLLWECERALVVSQLDALLPGFESAARASADGGWPVTVRKTGGSAVAIGPGVLNFSVIESWRGTPPALAHGLDLVCAPIIRALAQLGVTGTIGAAPGSFCDGKYNVLVDGRKIAGTAQRRTKKGDGGALLAHALILVGAAPVELTDAVQRFYARAGSDRRFDAGALTSLRERMGGRRAGDLTAAVANSLQQAYG
jgi:lipoate-protein ligase A